MAMMLLDLPAEMIALIVTILSTNPIDPLFLGLDCCKALHGILHNYVVVGGHSSLMLSARHWFIRAAWLSKVLLGPRYRRRQSIQTLPNMRCAAFMTREHTNKDLLRVNSRREAESHLEVFVRLLASGALPRLRVIEACYMHLGLGCAALLRPIIAGATPKLRELALVGDDLEDSFVLRLCDALQEQTDTTRPWKIALLPRLRTLRLANNALTGLSGLALGSAIGNGCLPNLGELSINRNQVGNDGVVAIVSGVLGRARRLPSNFKLYIYQTNVDAVGITRIAELFEAVVGYTASRLTPITPIISEIVVDAAEPNCADLSCALAALCSAADKCFTEVWTPRYGVWTPMSEVLVQLSGV